jgi:hypothetical protein
MSKKRISKDRTKTKQVRKIAAPRLPTSLNFQAPEFIYYKKGVWWSMLTVIIAGLIIINLILVQMYLLTVIVVTGLMVFVKYSLEKPKKVKIRLDSKGVKIKNHFYPWTSFVSFGLLQYKTGHTRIYLNHPGLISLPTSIELPKSSKIKTTDLQRFLRKHLPEKFIQRISIFDAINRYLRF